MAAFKGIYLAVGAMLLVAEASATGENFQRQHTDSACSVASIANVVNSLRSTEPPITPQALLALVGNGEWTKATSMGSDGISFAQLQLYLRQSLDRVGLAKARMEIFRPHADAASLDRLRILLSQRQTAEMVLASFDQGWLLGEASVGHVSPLGAYDPESGRVQILDVDPEHPIPYWVSDQELLAAMTRPSDDPTGDGLIFIIPASQ